MRSPDVPDLLEKLVMGFQGLLLHAICEMENSPLVERSDGIMYCDACQCLTENPRDVFRADLFNAAIAQHLSGHEPELLADRKLVHTDFAAIHTDYPSTDTGEATPYSRNIQILVNVFEHILDVYETN